MVARNPAAASKGLLQVLHTDAAGFEAAFERLVKRRQERADEIERTVRKIAERVRDGAIASSSPAYASTTARGSRSSR